MEQLKSRIEAVLFVTAKVLQIKDIAEILEEEPEKETVFGKSLQATAKIHKKRLN